MARVFVSHASKDRQLADELYGWLTGDGHEVFDPLRPGPVGAGVADEEVPSWSGDTAAVAGAILPGQRAFFII